MAMDVFDTLDDFMRNNGINWTNCFGVCTDGATVMTGRYAEVVQRIKAVTPVPFQHTVFCTETCLLQRTLNKSFTKLQTLPLTIVNFVKARATNSR